MRLVGVVVLLVVLIGLPFVFPVWGQLLAVPWYLVGVLGFCLGSVLLSYSPGEMKASWGLFLRNERTDSARHRALAAMHAALSRQALAAGSFVLLVGWVAVFCASKPPLVEDFGRALAGPIFGLMIGWGIHRPLANWHLRMSGDSAL